MEARGSSPRGFRQLANARRSFWTFFPTLDLLAGRSPHLQTFSGSSLSRHLPTTRRGRVSGSKIAAGTGSALPLGRGRRGMVWKGRLGEDRGGGGGQQGRRMRFTPDCAASHGCVHPPGRGGPLVLHIPSCSGGIGRDCWGESVCVAKSAQGKSPTGEGRQGTPRRPCARLSRRRQ